MAKSVGKYTGLGYRPLVGDISTDIFNAEDQEFRHRAEKRLEDDRKAAAKAKKDAARNAALSKIKHNKLFDTQSDSLNQVLGNTVKLAQQEYDDIFKVLENQDDYNLSEVTQAQLKLDYLNSGGLVDDLKILTSKVMGEYQDYTKGVADGTLFEDLDYEKKFENGYNGVTISLDDNLRPVALFKGTGQDLDGDGVLDIETMDSLNDVYARPNFQRNFNYDTTVKKHAEKLESAINQTDNGITKTKTTGVESDLLSDTVQRFLYNYNGTPTDPMKAFLRQRGMDANNPQHLKQVENDYKNDVYLRTKRGKIVDVDGGTALNYKKYNDENVKGVSFVESKQYGNGKDAVAQRYSFNSPYIIKGTNKSEQPSTLYEIRYDQQNGKIVLLGERYVGKTTTKTDEINGGMPTIVPRTREEFQQAQNNKKSSSSSTKDNWEPITISDKAEVTAILSNVMGVGSYDEISNQLKRNTEETDQSTSDFNWSEQ